MAGTDFTLDSLRKRIPKHGLQCPGLKRGGGIGNYSNIGLSKSGKARKTSHRRRK